MKKIVPRRAAFLIVLLTFLLSLPSLAASGAEQVNLHVGQTADTVYLTYTTREEAETRVEVTDSGTGAVRYLDGTAQWSDTTGKFMHTAALTGLAPGTDYTYRIGAFSGSFTTLSDSGSFTFGYITDPQIAYSADAKAVGALFAQLEPRNPAFLYIAGDMVDAPKDESQWEKLFQNGGPYAGAGQNFFATHPVALAQGNHDNSTFTGHFSPPSAGEAVGGTVYSFRNSNVTFVVLNLNRAETFPAQADFLRARAAEAKERGDWLFVGFHQSIYTGGSHIMDDSVSAGRRLFGPLMAELGVDAVLQGHDHIYARGFVTGQGAGAGLPVVRNAYASTSGAVLYLTGGHAGAIKWYSPVRYKVPEGDPIVPGYGYLDINSADPSKNPWGTDTCKTKEQAYTLVSVEGDTATFSTYLMKYDGKQGAMTTVPYLYDSLILKKGTAAQADRDAITALSVPYPPSDAPVYADVASDAWYGSAVQYAGSLGLLEGENGSFRPNDLFTRAELVAGLYRLAGSPAVAGGAVFPDVSASAPYAGAAAWARQRGVVNGMEDGSFRPDGAVTRAQMAVMLMRFFTDQGREIPMGSGFGTYRDWRSVDAWAYPGVSWAVNAGLLQGKNENRLEPRGNVTRAEGAVFLSRAEGLFR